MWSRTQTEYIAVVLPGSVTDRGGRASRRARRRARAITCGSAANSSSPRDQRSGARAVGEQAQRELAGAARDPSARAARWRRGRPASCASAAASRGSPRRARSGTARSPYQLISTIVASNAASRSASARPSGAPLAWITTSASPAAVARAARSGTPSAAAVAARAGIAGRQARPRSPGCAPRARRRGSRPRRRRSRARDRRLHGRVPQAVDRGLEVRGQHRARRRQPARAADARRAPARRSASGAGRGRTPSAPLEARRAALDHADARVAVLHRRREIAGLERRAHALVLDSRHPAGEHQRFGAAADPAVECAHAAPRRAPARAGFRGGSRRGRGRRSRTRRRLGCPWSHDAASRAGRRAEPGRRCSCSRTCCATCWPRRCWPRLGAWLFAQALGLGTAYLRRRRRGAGRRRAAAARAARRLLARSHPHPAFGAANRVTLGRAVGVVLLTGLAFEPPTEARAWAAVALAGAAALLDAVDGRLARRGGLASRFGARFDMETDALMILVLAALAWRWERAGAWVLLAGLLRYAFVLAGAAWPWLAGELPPSRRRQAICVVQVVGLILALVPWLPAPQAAAIAALSLGALCYSFAVDVRGLARRRSKEGVRSMSRTRPRSSRCLPLALSMLAACGALAGLGARRARALRARSRTPHRRLPGRAHRLRAHARRVPQGQRRIPLRRGQRRAQRRARRGRDRQRRHRATRRATATCARRISSTSRATRP